MAQPDPRPPQRVKDRELLRHLHLIWRSCALADDTCLFPLSLHHISKHPRDDVRGNCVMLCGSGTTGHHGKVEARDRETRAALRDVLADRDDVLAYLERRFGSYYGAASFLEREYPL